MAKNYVNKVFEEKLPNGSKTFFKVAAGLFCPYFRLFSTVEFLYLCAKLHIQRKLM